jgi:hypothetical protein
MDIVYFLESGGILIVAALIAAFAVARKKSGGPDWPQSLVVANALVISVVGLTALGIVLLIMSFAGAPAPQ